MEAVGAFALLTTLEATRTLLAESTYFELYKWVLGGCVSKRHPTEATSSGGTGAASTVSTISAISAGTASRSIVGTGSSGTTSTSIAAAAASTAITSVTCISSDKRATPNAHITIVHE